MIEPENQTAQETTDNNNAPDTPSFDSFNLSPLLLSAIHELGFNQSTPIQSESLPFTLQGADIVAQAQTGTGKTAAFLISCIQHCLTKNIEQERYCGEPRVLILAPTRELALQIEADAKSLAALTQLNILSLVGGMDYQKQRDRLNTEIIDLLIATPGRLLDFVNSSDAVLCEVEILVIDEADRMLDMGFIPDVRKLVYQTPKKEFRQTLFFSATYNPSVTRLAKQWTLYAEEVKVFPSQVTNQNVKQQVYLIDEANKFTLLFNLLKKQDWQRVIIFNNRRDETRYLCEKLTHYGISCSMISGEVEQKRRLRTLDGFKTGKIRVLVATDVAGRGIHVDKISHVVNYSLPEDAEDYVHRIGRTGRAGQAGTSISFASEDDAFELPNIEALIGEKLEYMTADKELLAPLPNPV